MQKRMLVFTRKTEVSFKGFGEGRGLQSNLFTNFSEEEEMIGFDMQICWFSIQKRFLSVKESIVCLLSSLALISLGELQVVLFMYSLRASSLKSLHLSLSSAFKNAKCALFREECDGLFYAV